MLDKDDDNSLSKKASKADLLKNRLVGDKTWQLKIFQPHEASQETFRQIFLRRSNRSVPAVPY